MSVRRPSLAAALALALLLVGQPGLRPASADDWGDVKKDFRERMKSEKWHERRDAFVLLTPYDGAGAVEELLDVLDDEENGAVVLAGIETLGLLVSPGAHDALLAAAKKEKGRVQRLVLYALEQQKGSDVDAVLLAAAKDRDPMVAAQAALVLGSRETLPSGAVPVLIDLLGHKDWQVRSAAARTLLRHPDKAAVPALAKALEEAEGRDRRDLVAALEKTTGETFGYDPKAWIRLAKGEDPASIPRTPVQVPTAFGIPIYGQRVVVVLDNSLRMSDPHPFDAARLRELCTTPDPPPVPWYRMKTNDQFAHGYVKHLVGNLPRGSKFGLVIFNTLVNNVFEGFIPAGGAAEKRTDDTLDGLLPDDGIDSYDALMTALNMGGAKEKSAWRNGPDEILFITVNFPTAGEVKEADVVAAAVGLVARLRLVPIHAVGIHFHPYDMCRRIAALSGGEYVSLVK